MNKTIFISIIFSIIAFFTLAPPSRAVDETTLEHAPYKQGFRTGTISDPGLEEVSGIFASRKNSPLLWVINDRGNTPVLYALSPDGKMRKNFPIAGIKNTDWEDLSGFRHKGEDFIMIGDVGDNRAKRKFCTLFIVKEPAPGDTAPLKLQWQMRFQYEDGPRDCEAIAVDGPNKKIFLLSKRDRFPVLYELPLVIHPPDTLYTAKPVAKIKNIPRPTPSDLKEKYGKYRSRPTSMDLSTDGNTLVILTYKHGYVYRRESNRTWKATFQSLPWLIRLPLPGTGELVQREALCINHGTGQLIVTTEQLPAPIYTLDPVKK